MHLRTWNGLCSCHCSSFSKMQTAMSKRWHLAGTTPQTSSHLGIVTTTLEVGDVQNAWHGSVPSNNRFPCDCNHRALLHRVRSCSQERATILLQPLGCQLLATSQTEIYASRLSTIYAVLQRLGLAWFFSACHGLTMMVIKSMTKCTIHYSTKDFCQTAVPY